jgi:hypothetical protein
MHLGLVRVANSKCTASSGAESAQPLAPHRPTDSVIRGLLASDAVHRSRRALPSVFVLFKSSG